jgi:hypothetical protein
MVDGAASEGRRRRLVIEVDVGADPISGYLTAEDAERSPFAGYMELLTWLEAMRRVTTASIRRGPQ